MSVDGNNRKIPEDEVRVKRFLIQEIKNYPSMWGRQGCEVAGRPAGGRSLSEDWKAILINIQEAFKNDPELLVKYKADTLSGLKKTWISLRDAHRRKWSSKIENDSKGKLEHKLIAASVGNCWALQNGSHILLSSESSRRHSGVASGRRVPTGRRHETGMAKRR